MIYHNEVQGMTQNAAVEFDRYSVRLWIVLSLIFSLAATVILSKRNLVSHRWMFLAAFAVPILLTLYFRNYIVRLGPVIYVAALLGMLGVGVFFGI